MEYRKILDSIRQPGVARPLQGIVAGALLGAILLAVLGSADLISIYMKEFQFENAAKREAQLAAADGRPETEIRDELLHKAQSLGLPIDGYSIQIRLTGPSQQDKDTGSLLTALGVANRTTNTGHVDISVSYDVPYRLFGSSRSLHFRFAVNDRSI